MSVQLKRLVQRDGERGSVTMFTVVLVLAIAGAGLVATAVMQLAVVRATLSSYADLSALAASSSINEPCLAAKNIAVDNRVNLDRCLLDSDSVLVTLSTSTESIGLVSIFLNNSRVQVTARASRSVW